MKSILKVQKDSVNTLKEEILSHSNKDLKKIYVISSDIKESGYDIIEECLIDLKAKKFIAFGIDKKNTTRKMLDNILRYTKTVYVWDNNQQVEFNANIYVFEYDNEAYVYLAQGSTTESMLETDISIFTKLEFDLIKDKKEYEEYIATLVKQIKESFVKLTKEYIDELVENKLIFTTKQYMHVVPSIAELLGKNEEKEDKVEEIEIQKIPKIQLQPDDLNSFEIDLGDIAVEQNETEEKTVKQSGVEVEEELATEEFGLYETNYEQYEPYEISDEAIDMESMILESKVIKFNKADIEKRVDSKKNNENEKQLSKKINLSKVSNIIMELSAKPSKGKDVGKIKIPNYIKDMIPHFFDIMENAKVVKTQDGEYKEAKIKLEVIDVNTSNKYVDNEAYIRQKVGQTYIEFESSKLENIMYEEMDIARVIRLANNSYHIEIIPRGIDEYSLWDKMCTNNFKGSTRQYGLM